METFTCADCGKTEPVKTDGATGYAVTETGDKICYVCCAVRDEKYMLEHGKITLYLSKDSQDKWTVSNWPGTLRFPVIHLRTGRHNIAGKQYRAYFKVHGRDWTGVQYGDNTQIIRCKQMKGERK